MAPPAGSGGVDRRRRLPGGARSDTGPLAQGVGPRNHLRPPRAPGRRRVPQRSRAAADPHLALQRRQPVRGALLPRSPRRCDSRRPARARGRLRGNPPLRSAPPSGSLLELAGGSAARRGGGRSPARRNAAAAGRAHARGCAHPPRVPGLPARRVRACSTGRRSRPMSDAASSESTAKPSPGKGCSG